MLRIALLSSAALVAVTSASFAADLPNRTAPMAAPYAAAPMFTWTGVYVGAQVGYGWGSAPSPYGLPSTATTFPLYQAASKQSGAFGGVHAGYNYQLGTFVLGVEGDVNADGINGNDGGSGGDVNGVKHSWNGSLRARAGLAAFDRALIYATGGVAFLQGSATAPFESIDTTWTGWTIGAGVEYAITNNVTTRLEYRYSDYGSSVARFPLNGSSGNYAENIDPRISTVLVGITYKF